MAEIFAGFKWIALLDDRELFIEGLMTTLEVAVLALLLSLILGIIFGIAGVFPKKWVRCVDRVYVEFFQNTPLVIQAIFLYHDTYWQIQCDGTAIYNFCLRCFDLFCTKLYVIFTSPLEI